MDDELIGDAVSPERQSLIPGEGFFIPDSVSRQQTEESLATTLADASTVIIADPDADGLTCVALLRERHADAQLVDVGPHELADGLDLVAEYLQAEARVYICDLAPDTIESIREPLTAIREQAHSVHWFDHHQWNEAVEAYVRETAIELVIGESDSECTADVLSRSLDTTFADHLNELIAVTRDHDLWIRDDPRSEDLADFAQWSDPENFVETVREHGPDLPESVQADLAERRLEKADRIERALRRAEYHDVAGTTVGITYGRCSQNEVAESMREEGANAAIVIKPAGSVSLRGTDSFQRCHEVAQRLNGGGHPEAAGCKPDIYADMLDYAHHWTTEGATAKRVLLETVRTVLTGEEDSNIE